MKFKTSRRAGVFLSLKRHPFSVKADFRHSLVLTYAFPEPLLEPLLPPGLVLDTCKGFGFIAVALVQTRALRPSFCPRFLGKDFFLSGYRIFTRHKNRAGRNLRGLRILRSDTDSKWLCAAGNLLTHYNYRHARVDVEGNGKRLVIVIKTPNSEADLHVIADLTKEPTQLPEQSPFANWHEARLFAGPLPFTFDYEQETHSMVLIEGVRQNWNPRPVKVNVIENTFFNRAPFAGVEPLLANAFYVENIPYQWKRGICEPLPR